MISRIEPMAMKMSSPKKRPMLSVAAAQARMRLAFVRQRAVIGSRRRASAIGATSGPHHLGMAAERGEAERRR